MSKQTIDTLSAGVSSSATQMRAHSANVIQAMIERISSLAVKREVWEASEYDRSNQALYRLMGECLSLYRDLICGDNAKLMKQGLDDYINLKGYVFKSSSPLSLKVIRCVFGDRDRRRLSTYHTVLRVAIAEGWSVGDVPSHITACGGVQEISLRKPSGVSARDKADAARATLMDQSIATLSSEAISRQFNAEHIGDSAVALLTLNADSTYSVHCVVRSKTAVTATLAGYFSANREVIKELQRQQQAQGVDRQREQVIANAGTAANSPNQPLVA